MDYNNDVTDSQVIKLLVDEGLAVRTILAALNNKALDFTRKEDERFVVQQIVASGVTGASMGAGTTNSPNISLKKVNNTYDTVYVDVSIEKGVYSNSGLDSEEVNAMNNSLTYIHDSLLIGGYCQDEMGRLSTLPKRNLVSLSNVQASPGTWDTLSLTEIKTQFNTALDNAKNGALTKKRNYNALYMSESAYRKAGSATAPTDAQGFTGWVNSLGLQIYLDPMLDSVQDENGADLGGVAFLYPREELLAMVGLLPSMKLRQSGIHQDAKVLYLPVGGVFAKSAVAKPATMIKGIA